MGHEHVNPCLKTLIKNYLQTLNFKKFKFYKTFIFISNIKWNAVLFCLEDKNTHKYYKIVIDHLFNKYNDKKELKHN